MAEVVELHKLKLAELKQECTARGLDAKGNKSDLISRLQAYLEEHEEEVNEEEVLGGFGEETFAKEESTDKKEELSPTEMEPEKKLVKLNPPVVADERLQKRAERFNVPLTGDNKKAARAARFGVTAPESSKGASTKTNVDVEVLKKRAERFGMNVSSVSKKWVEDDEKLKKRKERFGIVTSASSSGGGDDSEAKKRKRAERFGNV